ncbi:hypothetical protein [Streptomyces californicus]|uniref:hypothetical protein n=1 Tax=Streptomyces californicus TaxID=67351 RepID=UPI0037204455
MTTSAARLTPPWEAAAICKHCRQPITLFKGLWWTADDDFSCPDGEEQHAPLEPSEGTSIEGAAAA